MNEFRTMNERPSLLSAHERTRLSEFMKVLTSVQREIPEIKRIIQDQLSK